MSKTVQKKYVKVSVPVQDATVWEWLTKQNNVSDSIRALIRNDVESNGFDDVFCRPVFPKPKVGRPTNAEVQMREQMLQVAQRGQEMVNESSSFPDSMQEVATVRPQMQPVVTNVPQATSAVQDDDGFVDPESLLSL